MRPRKFSFIPRQLASKLFDAALSMIVDKKYYNREPNVNIFVNLLCISTQRSVVFNSRNRRILSYALSAYPMLLLVLVGGRSRNNAVMQCTNRSSLCSFLNGAV